jgi:hypothetical protein
VQFPEIILRSFILLLESENAVLARRLRFGPILAPKFKMSIFLGLRRQIQAPCPRGARSELEEGEHITSRPLYSGSFRKQLNPVPSPRKKLS